MPLSFKREDQPNRVTYNTKTVRDVVGAALIVIGFCLGAYAGCILLYQCLLWLRDGYWTDLQFRLAWEYFGLTEPHLEDARGVEKIRTAMLDLPLCLGVFLCSVAVCLSGGFFLASADEYRRRSMEEQRRREQWERDAERAGIAISESDESE